MNSPKASVPAVAGATISAPVLNEGKRLSFLPKFLCTGENRKLFIDWLSGLASGFVSVTACAPLDLARTRHMILATTNSYGQVNYKGFFHTLKTIYSQEGFSGLYRGYNVTAISIPIFQSLYFTIFYKAKRYFGEKMTQSSTLLVNIISAITTGFICDTLTNPLWVVRTRIQAQHLHRGTVPKYTGMIDGLTQMYKQEGIKSFYKGLFTSYVGLSHAAILYPSYEAFKTRLREWKGHDLSSLDIFCVSLSSKLLAMVATYPHVVIRTRQQDQRTKGSSFVTMFKETIHREGFKGLYSGLRIDLIRVLPANAITFTTFEYVKKHLQTNMPEY